MCTGAGLKYLLGVEKLLCSKGHKMYSGTGLKYLLNMLKSYFTLVHQLPRYCNNDNLQCISWIQYH